MTIPVERTRAVLYTREFLYALLDPRKTPRIPRAVRRGASACLRHYPGVWDMRTSAERCPDVWGAIDGP